MDILIQLINSSFYPFVKFCIILCIILRFLFVCWRKFLRTLNIRKHGYPPNHCDADGDTYYDYEDEK